MFEKERQGIIMALLDVKNVRKVYTTRFGGNQVEALKDVNFSVEQGEFYLLKTAKYFIRFIKAASVRHRCIRRFLIQ